MHKINNYYIINNKYKIINNYKYKLFRESEKIVFMFK